ncbi:hypothetical protein [Morganella psychrotolerans]|uniref:Uncharacterized protein n=1 Tax=Morganella psychrotolerans TaxID=368603 RepID=A0A1B8HSN6_9GAMM|nr:hypothetical protein [Morganella psychrotolerans]OBU12527.1 hypothetical protein AYY18_15450 [Morganella psychrotolerans]
MLRNLVIGLLVIPAVSLAAFDDLSLKRGPSGNLEVVDANYTCNYRSIDDAKDKSKNAGEVTLYTEKLENDSIFFIVGLPGDVSISSPQIKKTKAEKSAVVYMGGEGNDGYFMVGSSVDNGVGAAIKTNDGKLNASIIVDDCHLLRNLENPAPADVLPED